MCVSPAVQKSVFILRVFVKGCEARRHPRCWRQCVSSIQTGFRSEVGQRRPGGRAPGFSTNWPVSFDKKTTRLSLAETQQVGRIIFRGMGAVSVFPWFKHSEAVAPCSMCWW